MANINAPKGFIPVRHLDGSPYNGQYELFLIPASDGNAVFVGDVVNWGGSAGTAGQFVAGMNCEGMPTAASNAASTTISAGTSIAGVVRGFLVDPTNLALKHRAASTARIAMVVTDPTVVFEIQENATAPFAAADVGLNLQFTTGTGSTTTGMSGHLAMNAGKATTSTLPLRFLGLAPRPDNAFNTAGAGTDPAKILVWINASGNAFGGAGVAGT